MKAVRWKLLNLSCQNHSADKVPLWPWPLDPKMYRYLPLTILHLCKKYWKLFKLSCHNWSVDKVPLWHWPLDPKMYRHLPLTILHLCMKYESCTLQTTQVIVSEPNLLMKFDCDLDLWTSKCIGIFLSPSCIHVWNMKAVHWKLLKLSCQNQSVDKFRCDLDLWTPKCIGIFLSPSCIYVWNMKAVHWKLLKLLCQNQSVDKVPLWPWPLTFWPHNVWYLPLPILHICMKYECCTLKITQVIVSEPKCWQTDGRTDSQTDRQMDGQTNLIPIGRPPTGGALIKVNVTKADGRKNSSISTNLLRLS